MCLHLLLKYCITFYAHSVLEVFIIEYYIDEDSCILRHKHLDMTVYVKTLRSCIWKCLLKVKTWY